MPSKNTKLTRSSDDGVCSQILKKVQREKKSRILGKRISFDRLKLRPLRVLARHGEGYTGLMLWDEPKVVTIRYGQSVNPDGEPGIQPPGDVFGYAGFYDLLGAYSRYTGDGLSGTGEYFFQILAIL